MHRLAWVGGLLSVALVAACSRGQTEGAPGGRAPLPSEWPAFVDVTGQETEVGFDGERAGGTTRPESFRMMRAPVTLRDLRACIGAGACAASEPVACRGTSPAAVLAGSTLAATVDDLPATCVNKATAESYCAWLGGDLPSSAEWLLAARGPKVQRYAWGSEAPTCKHHPVASGLLASSTSCCPPGEACTPLDLAMVGTHPAGASPLGMHDVLVGGGEIIKSQPGACGSQGTCLVVGEGGAPEGLRSVAPSDEAPVFTFRCVVRKS